jgi:hypothetical protein
VSYAVYVHTIRCRFAILTMNEPIILFLSFKLVDFSDPSFINFNLACISSFSVISWLSMIITVLFELPLRILLRKYVFVKKIIRF